MILLKSRFRVLRPRTLDFHECFAMCGFRDGFSESARIAGATRRFSTPLPLYFSRRSRGQRLTSLNLNVIVTAFPISISPASSPDNTGIIRKNYKEKAKNAEQKKKSQAKLQRRYFPPFVLPPQIVLSLSFSLPPLIFLSLLSQTPVVTNTRSFKPPTRAYLSRRVARSLKDAYNRVILGLQANHELITISHSCSLPWKCVTFYFHIKIKTFIFFCFRFLKKFSSF